MRFFLALSTLTVFLPAISFAHGIPAVPHRVAVLEVRGALPPPPAGVTNVKFGDFFRTPVGPFGLEPTDKLVALNGRRVRLIGYMVREERSAHGRFLLSPLPVSLGDEDEGQADDLPPSTVFVHLRGNKERAVPYVAGLIKLTGILELGARDEEGGRVSTVRLDLDARDSRQILRAKPVLRAAVR